MTDLVWAVNVLRNQGARRIAYCTTAGAAATATFEPVTDLRELVIPDLSDSVKFDLQQSGWAAYGLSDVPNEIDALLIVNVDMQGFRSLMRALEPVSRRNCLVLPANKDWVVPRLIREGDLLYTAWHTSPAVNYVSRCNLKGHYLEFGVFWGGSFFPNYFRLRHWLRGSFFAFDSFRGLSIPMTDETLYTAGDFQAGAYCVNERSFVAMAEFLNVLAERIRVVAGFYDETLHGVDPSVYGLEPLSVSVCFIDCDLKEPTGQVLAFVTPLLEPGALICFDDWRLCRASRRVGERAAALEWLNKNPDVELVEFDRDWWQNQWFIFQRH